MTDSQKHLDDELAQDSSILLKALGGWQGLIDAALPTAAFLAVFTVTQEIRSAVYVALGCTAVLLIVRMLTKKSLQQVFSGVFGLVLSAYLATKTGKAENFFVIGILQNSAYFAVCLISIVIRKPILGYIISVLRGQPATAWLQQSHLRSTYSAVTWLWVLVFGVRVAITAPLYFAGLTTQLGTAKLILGTPLYALAVFISYRVVVTRESVGKVVS